MKFTIYEMLRIVGGNTQRQTTVRDICLILGKFSATQKKKFEYTLYQSLYKVSAAHVQSSKNNRFCRYYVMFGRNDRSALVGKIPVFMRKY